MAARAQLAIEAARGLGLLIEWLKRKYLPWRYFGAAKRDLQAFKDRYPDICALCPDAIAEINRAIEKRRNASTSAHRRRQTTTT
jgi:hypothetical protein